MILGLNTDVKHKGKTFHIQTEDSGKGNPVLVTHVFIGGTIIATRKSDYEDELEKDDLEALVRKRMRTQHREAYEALLAGEYDEAARRRPKNASQIPLARQSKAPGLLAPEPKTVSAPPPDSLDDADDEPIESSVIHLDSVDMLPLEDTGSMKGDTPPVEFPTRLASKRPLDRYRVSRLLEYIE